MAAGGVLSGEHGIGLEKRDFMRLLFSDDDLAAQAWLRDAFDPDGVCKPVEGAARGLPLRRPPEPPPRSLGVKSVPTGTLRPRAERTSPI